MPRLFTYLVIYVYQYGLKNILYCIHATIEKRICTLKEILRHQLDSSGISLLSDDSLSQLLFGNFKQRKTNLPFTPLDLTGNI